MERNLGILEKLEEEFLTEGYLETYKKMIPFPLGSNEEETFPIVLLQNDVQENNIMMKLDNNRELILIDYEYSGWGPIAMDLAAYFNETMLDNSYTVGRGGVYLDNCMTIQELKAMVSAYLATYFEQFMNPKVRARYDSCSDFIEKELSNMCAQVFEQARMHNFLTILWSFAMMPVDECSKTDGFLFDFALARMQMFHKAVEIET